MSKGSWRVVVGVGLALALFWPRAESTADGDAAASQAALARGSAGSVDERESSEWSAAARGNQGRRAWSTEADESPDEPDGPGVELFGWVFDVRGVPLAGVSVTAGRTPERRGWRAVTGRDGGFVFARFPTEPLRVTADGGERGLATRWVEPTRKRQEVSLMLEPTAFVIVQSEVGGSGRVIICSLDWFDYGDVAESERPELEEGVGEGVGVGVGVGVGEGEALGFDVPEALAEVLGVGLVDFDPNRADEEITTMVLALMERLPSGPEVVVALFDQEVGARSREDIARATAASILASEPDMPEVLALAAASVRDGAEPLAAVLAANRERRLAALEEAATASEDEQAESVMSDEDSEFMGRDIDLYMESLRHTYGPMVTYRGTGGHAIVELGRVGELIRLRGANT